MISENSKLKEIYRHPIGRDIIRRILLQMGKGEFIVTNPIVSNLKLKHLKKLSKGMVDDSFITTVVDLLNSETEISREDVCPIREQWWKEAVFYQIYPRSFKDSNGDGIGDIRGIIEKLDYLKDLGIGALWLSPIYDSPNDDNGYDIRDYRKIMAEFGTMEDFNELLEQVHKKGMRLIMDLVVNHTSDEHQWFVNAVKNKDNEYSDYYIFRDKPNNWTSFFSGEAWNYYDSRKQYGLHLFSKKQMDLNWDNEKVREEVISMINWWLDKGVDGFRMDVINYISKRPGLPNGNEKIAELMGFCGVEHYFYGPNLHKYLKELNCKAFSPHNAITVGETPGVGMEMSKLLTGDYRNEMDMVFSFDHLENPGKVRFDDYEYDLNYYKKCMVDWMENYTNYCQPTIFYENHDNPRMISKILKDESYRNEIGKLLAVMEFTLRGTPFVFQGQEIGKINTKFKSIDEIKDVESINYYRELCKKITEEEAFRIILAGTRDHARTPMQWDSSENGGFTTGKPWISGDDDYKQFSVDSELLDEKSVLNFYKKIIEIRKNNKALIYGSFKSVDFKRKNIFAYEREYNGNKMLIECNLSKEIIKGINMQESAKCVISTYYGKEKPDKFLQPYEGRVWII